MLDLNLHHPRNSVKLIKLPHTKYKRTTVHQLWLLPRSRLRTATNLEIWIRLALGPTIQTTSARLFTAGLLNTDIRHQVAGTTKAEVCIEVMATNNPMEKTYFASPAAVSKKTFTIAGILTTVYGLEELPLEIKNVTCLWLLHPRLQTQACMEPIADSSITDWNRRLQESKSSQGQASMGLIAVSFDQRNHGTREVDSTANEAWRSGNPKHAQDMFSIYRTSLKS